MGAVKRELKADGDKWSVRLGERPASEDVQTLLFFCVTTSQRPYRVLEVPRGRVPDAAALAALSDGELMEHFTASRSMDFPRDYPGHAPAGS